MSSPCVDVRAAGAVAGAAVPPGLPPLVARLGAP